MPGLFTTQTVSILPATQQGPGATKSLAAQIQGATRGTDVEQFGNMAGRAVQNIQDQVNTIMNALRLPLPFPNTIAITDASGNVEAFLGPSTPEDPNPIWASSIGIGSPAAAPSWQFTFSGATGHISGDGSLNITLTPSMEVTLTDVAGNNAFFTPSEYVVEDTSSNIATLTPTSLTIQNGSSPKILINLSTIQQTIAGILTAQIQTQSWFNELAVGGTSPIAPTFLSLNDGTTRISFPSGDLLLMDDTHFIQFGLVSGAFATLSPATGVEYNSGGAVFSRINNLGQALGHTTLGGDWQIAGNGLKIQGFPSANPGVGSKAFWYDPADGNRVKYAP